MIYNSAACLRKKKQIICKSSASFSNAAVFSLTDNLQLGWHAWHWAAWVVFANEKQVSCSIELTNDTDYYMAFRIATTSLLPFSIQPNKGIAAPRSKCRATITLSAQEMTPLHNQCEELTVESTRAHASLTAVDVTDDMFNDEGGNSQRKNWWGG